MATKQQTKRAAILARLKRNIVSLRTLEKRTSETTWSIAQDLLALRGTYPPEGEKAFLATATKATGYDESTIRSMIAAAEVRAKLAGTAAGKESADWTLHVMRAVFPSLEFLAPLQARETSKVAREVNRRGAHTNEKAARAVRREVLGESPRGGRKSTAKKAEDLAKKLRERVAGLLASGFPPLALIAGARLAEEYGAGTADAILAVSKMLRAEKTAAAEEAAAAEKTAETATSK
jgi:hypothetical protein